MGVPEPSAPGPSARQEAVERALTNANLQRRRGEYELAWRALDDALVMAPQHPPLLEMMGQLNLDEQQYAAAAQCFKRALDLEPGRQASEIGFAEATLLLKQSEADAAAGPDPILAARSPSEAALRSTLVPGMGQAYAGDLNRGLVFLIPWLMLWTGLAWSLWGALNGKRHFGPNGLLGDIGPGAWTLVAVLLVWHLVSGLDAGALMKRLRGSGGEAMIDFRAEEGD